MAVCYCRREATIRTSWTELNPGRRFYSCALDVRLIVDRFLNFVSDSDDCRKLNVQGGNCGFFGWVDPPMCARSSEVIPGPLRSKNLLEKEVKKLKGELKRKNATVKMMFVLLVCCVGVYLFY
ncbi:hypothetical protein SSX86_016583 [Deinandra increscens subsp. villosa]|uniref:GRF-type domain-containing protein n=1 Tax=Deinandra increscens subsp. villosa TaxID=3103831 RepID=A0AAP0CYA3_9ASTR